MMDIMRKRLETTLDSAPVQDAARKTNDKDISSLVVVDKDGILQGLVTERDLVTKLH
jgi:CBS domain-containing protein